MSDFTAQNFPVAAGDDDENPKKKRGDSLFDAMRRTRTILFSSDVNSKSVRECIEKLLVLEADDADKPITILLNSPGGSVSDGYALVDVIRFIRPPVRVVGAGMVASMGISLILSVPAERRFSLPSTRFMLHQPRFMGLVTGQISDLEITAIEMVKMKDKSNREVAERTGQSIEKIEQDTKRDLWLSATEAKEYGIVSAVIESVRDIPEA